MTVRNPKSPWRRGLAFVFGIRAREPREVRADPFTSKEARNQSKRIRRQTGRGVRG
jgi:hypothetical protein